MRTFASRVARVVGALLALLLGILVALATAETLAWAIFEVSWAEASEIQAVLLVWFGLLSAVYGIHHRVHLGVEMMTRRLPDRWQIAIDRSVSVIVAIFGGLLAVYGAKLVASVNNTLPATGLSAALQYVPTVVCGGLMVFFAVVDAITGVDQRNALPTYDGYGETDD